MKTDAAAGGAIEKLVLTGNIVMAVDLRGIGETRFNDPKRDWAKGLFGPNLQPMFMAYLGGKSFVGLRTQDILASVEILRSATGLEKFDLVAEGVAGIPALHAAAIKPELFTDLRLTGEVQTWQDFFEPTQPWDQAINVVHGALLHYDLPDLIEMAKDGGVSVDAPAIEASAQKVF